MHLYKTHPWKVSSQRLRQTHSQPRAQDQNQEFLYGPVRLALRVFYRPPNSGMIYKDFWNRGYAIKVTLRG